MRFRKPRKDLTNYENDHCIALRSEKACVWIVKCKHCGEEHEQNVREIQNNAKTRQCETFKPHNYTGLDKRDVVIRNQYGITLEQYDNMLEAQDYKCAICGNEDEVEGRRLAIDHCHTTGKVRGLLCGKCNRGLGLFYDNQELLSNAIKYLTKEKLCFIHQQTDNILTKDKPLPLVMCNTPIIGLTFLHQKKS